MKKRIVIGLVLVIMVIITGCVSVPESNNSSSSSDTESSTNESEAAEESVFDDQENFPGMLTTETVRSGLEAEAKKVTDHTLKVGFCPSAVDVYYNRIWYGIQDTLSETGYDIEFDYQAPSSQTATDEAVTIVEGWIAQEYDAICLTIADEASLMPVIREATNAGIPVFLFNSPEFENDYYVSNIGYDQQYGGYLLGQYVGEYYKDQDAVDLCFVIGVAGDTFTRQRMSGFYEAIEEFSNINILDEQAANWSRADAASVSEDLIQAYPDMDGFVTLFDDMGLGIYQTVKSAGLDTQIDIFGYDNMKDIYDFVADGTNYIATVDTCTYVTGRNMVYAVQRYCVEGQVIPKTIFMSPTTYDETNIGEFDYLQYGEGEKE
ncbi:MAG: sugar ABC transporter substrate-binding protein [Suipraeoptans sp.]